MSLTLGIGTYKLKELYSKILFNIFMCISLICLTISPMGNQRIGAENYKTTKCDDINVFTWIVAIKCSIQKNIYYK